MTTDERLSRLEAILGSDRYMFQKHLQFLDGKHIQVGKNYGTKIGTEVTQKLGFFGNLPVVQQGAITTPSGGGSSFGDAVDITGRTAIGQIKTALHALGFVA